MRRFISAAAVSISLLCLSAGAVLAAAPSNDTYAGAITIGSLPFSTTVDTTEATTDETDLMCQFVGTHDATVWYEFTAATDTRVLVDTAGSSYSTSVAVASRSPGHELVECGSGGAILFTAEAGVSYSIMIADDQGDGGGNGGTLVLSVSEAPPAPVIDLVIDPVGSFNLQTGFAMITGTVTCPSSIGEVFVGLELTQRGVADIGAASSVPCNGTAEPWSITVPGQFRGGKATVEAFAVRCLPLECVVDEEELTVRLRR